MARSPSPPAPLDEASPPVSRGTFMFGVSVRGRPCQAPDVSPRSQRHLPQPRPGPQLLRAPLPRGLGPHALSPAASQAGPGACPFGAAPVRPGPTHQNPGSRAKAPRGCARSDSEAPGAPPAPPPALGSGYRVCLCLPPAWPSLVHNSGALERPQPTGSDEARLA